MPENQPLHPDGDARFDKKLSVVIPAYNEAGHIQHTISVVVETLASFSDNFEIIVVNDGSDDDTYACMEQASHACNCVKCVDSPVNLGKGGALKLGVEAAENRGYIAFLDADLDLHPRQLIDFFGVMRREHADVVIGSKMHPDSKLYYPKIRRLMSLCYYLVLKILFGLNVHDTQTGVKLFRAEALKKVMPVILVKRFAYDIEVLSIFNSLGMKISEAPIELRFQRESGWGRIRLSDIARVGWDTAAVFYRLRILHYYDHVLKDPTAAV